MSKIRVKVINQEKGILAQSEGWNEVNLVYLAEYEPGDKILLEVEEVNTFYHIRFDEAKDRAFVYLTGDVEYEIPFEKKRLSPLAFTGRRHIISAKKAFPEEKMNYRNLAENVWDQDGNINCYPHASANVSFPGRPLLAAQSVIDGLTFTQQHASWPYSSWSICRKEDAAWRLDFGRVIEMDKLVIYMRADYPHDSWWTGMTVTFSDKSKKVIELEKGGHAQIFDVHKETAWLEISDLVKADDPSPFPALTQLQVYGKG